MLMPLELSYRQRNSSLWRNLEGVHVWRSKPERERQTLTNLTPVWRLERNQMGELSKMKRLDCEVDSWLPERWKKDGRWASRVSGGGCMAKDRTGLWEAPNSTDKC